jgi:hypothetical protein
MALADETDGRATGDLPDGVGALRLLLERSAASSGPKAGDLLEAAVRFQAETWGQSEAQARSQVHALCDQVRGLAKRAPWFAADERLRALALDEMVARTTRGEVVSSAEAQLAWLAAREAERDFEVGGSALPDPEVIREAHIRPNEADVTWLERWQAWAEQQEAGPVGT